MINELCGRQGKGRIKRGCINFDTPSFLIEKVDPFGGKGRRFSDNR